jgi:hypothetical protein
MADAVDHDAAALAGTPSWRCDDTATGRGLDAVEVGASPGSVGGVGVDAGRTVGEVEGEVGEDATLTAGGGCVEVGQPKDDAVVGQSRPDGGDSELRAPDQVVNAALAVSVRSAGSQLRGKAGTAETLGFGGRIRASPDVPGSRFGA